VSGSATRENSALPTASLKRKANRILLSSSDEEDVKEATPPPKKKPAVAPAPTTSRERAVQQQSKQSTSSKVNAKRKKKVSDYESSADEGTADSDSDFMDVDEDEMVKKKTAANAKKNTKSTNAAPTGKGRVKGTSKEDPLKVECEDKDSSIPKPKFKYESSIFETQTLNLIPAGLQRKLRE